MSSVFIMPLEPPEPSRWERVLAAITRRVPRGRRREWTEIGYTTEEDFDG